MLEKAELTLISMLSKTKKVIIISPSVLCSVASYELFCTTEWMLEHFYLLFVPPAKGGGMEISMISKMTSGSVVKTLLKFTMPVLFAQILQQLYNIVDTIIVGKYLGVDALASVGATWSLNYIVGFFCIGTCTGMSIPLSQSYGAENKEQLRCYFVNGVYFVVVLALVITTITSFLSRNFLIWLHTPSDIIEGAYTYLLILFLGIPFTILYNFCFGVLMAFGDSKKSSIFMAISTLLNFILDILMIMKWKLGIAGVGISTVISNGIAGLLSLFYILKKYKILYPKAGEWKPQLTYIKNIIKMCVPMGLQYSITAIGAVILQYGVNALGSTAVAAFSSGSKVKGFLLCPLNALGTTLSSFAGQNFGAGSIKRIKEGVRKSLGLGIFYSFVVIIVIFFTSEHIAALFVSRDNVLVIKYVKEFMMYSSVFQIELALLYAIRYTIQGMGYGQYAICSALAEMVGRSFMAVFVVPRFGFDAVCWSEGITFFAGIVVILPIYLVLINRVWKKENVDL